jgi:hypothetical protein
MGPPPDCESLGHPRYLARQPLPRGAGSSTMTAPRIRPSDGVAQQKTPTMRGSARRGHRSHLDPAHLERVHSMSLEGPCPSVKGLRSPGIFLFLECSAPPPIGRIPRPPGPHPGSARGASSRIVRAAGLPDAVQPTTLE